MGLAGGDPRRALGRRQAAAGAGIERPPSGAVRGMAGRGDLPLDVGAGAEAGIEQAARRQPVQRRAVVRQMRATGPAPGRPSRGRARPGPPGSPRRIPAGSGSASMSSSRSRKRPPAAAAAPRRTAPHGHGRDAAARSGSARSASPRRAAGRAAGDAGLRLLASPHARSGAAGMGARRMASTRWTADGPALGRPGEAAGGAAARARRRWARPDRPGRRLGARRCRTPPSSRRTRRRPATWGPTAGNGSACRTAGPR